jgi:hypothetical protein
MAGMRAFFVPTDEIGAAQGSKVGIGWLARLAAEKVAGEPMIIVHAKNMAGNNKFMAAASATFRWETTRTWYGSPWHGGPVLALFPTARALNAILERSHLITYLCVVESSGEGPEAWLRARRPTYLIGAPPPESPALDPEVAGALVSLTAFVNTAHYGNTEDVAQGIWTCQQLMRLGYRLDAAAFESFALVNRWDPEAASRFGDGPPGRRRAPLPQPGVVTPASARQRRRAEVLATGGAAAPRGRARRGSITDRLAARNRRRGWGPGTGRPGVASRRTPLASGAKCGERAGQREALTRGHTSAAGSAPSHRRDRPAR